MATAKRMHEDEVRKIEITLTRTVTDKISYADGYNIKTGREVYESYDVVLTQVQTGKTVRTHGKPGSFAFFDTDIDAKMAVAGAYARIGDAYITKGPYDICQAMIAELDAELPKTEEQIAIEAEARRASAAGNAWLASAEYKKMIDFERRMDDPNSDL